MAHTLRFRRLLRLLREARRPSLPEAGPLSSSVSRRTVLKVGAAATVTASLLDEFAPARAQTGATVAVIGGGLAGLSAAIHLQRAGVRVTVYEATDRLGGRVRSARDVVAPGLVTDFGGQFINSDHADMLALAEAHRVPLVHVEEIAETLEFANSAFHLMGHLVPEAEVAAMLRPLADRMAADAALLEEDWDTHGPAFDSLSVAEYLDRHATLLTPAVRTLVVDVIRSEYGAEPQEASVLQLLFTLPTVADGSVTMLSESDEAYMVAEGSEALAEALAAALAVPPVRGKALARIAPDGAGHRLTFADGTEATADATVIAVPQTALSAIRFDVALPPLLPEFMAEVSLGRNEKVMVGFEGRPWRQPNGFDADCWTSGPTAVLWDDGLRQPNLPASGLTLYCGGVQVDTLRAEGAARVADAVIGSLDGALPGLAAARNGSIVATEWSTTPGLSGAYLNLRPGQTTRFASCFWVEADDPADSQAVVEGRLAFAGEQFSEAYYGYMNGAAQTGRLAAAALVAALAG